MSFDGTASIARLETHDIEAARTTFALMADVFDEESGPLSDEYLVRLLGRRDFWALSASVGSTIVGGLTAHELLMTRSEAVELFLYDIAVHVDHQRRGLGRRLVESLLDGASEAGIDVVFVPAADDDADALDFYRALGGRPSPVTIFDLGRSLDDGSR